MATAKAGKKQSGTKASKTHNVEKFAASVRALISYINAHCESGVPPTDNDERIPALLHANARMLLALKRAARQVQAELDGCHRPKIAAETEFRRILRRYTFSWELIPGLSSAKHSCSPLDMSDAVALLELALKTRRGVLVTGGRGQGKSMLVRYTVRRLRARPAVYADLSEVRDVGLLWKRFVGLAKAILVFDNVLPGHCQFVAGCLQELPIGSTMCVVSADDQVVAELLPSMCTLRVLNPTAQSLAHLHRSLARRVNPQPRFAFPHRSRLALVQAIQLDLLNMQCWEGDDAIVRRHLQERAINAVLPDTANKQKKSLQKKASKHTPSRHQKRHPRSSKNKQLKKARRSRRSKSKRVCFPI